jgi:hypothetical protein
MEMGGRKMGKEELREGDPECGGQGIGKIFPEGEKKKKKKKKQAIKKNGLLLRKIVKRRGEGRGKELKERGKELEEKEKGERRKKKERRKKRTRKVKLGNITHPLPLRAQYCLVKSVQPDASAPEFANRVVVYSRATYFSLLCILILCLNEALRAGSFAGVSSFYGVNVEKALVVSYIVEGFRITLLCFPILFAGGLFPHALTFSNYCLEQAILHGFGGTGEPVTRSSSLCSCLPTLSSRSLSMYP